MSNDNFFWEIGALRILIQELTIVPIITADLKKHMQINFTRQKTDLARKGVIYYYCTS